ncbi:DMT family transporter [Isoptericola sp. b441]|uniref:DMT family transporter n=1 Tax=Actinotalea lenta TaxID=3064654 RepID=A0ABT9D656_9CELL|nr:MULTISPECIES: DMT family transporter [unclassified Isoptericola]MDO8106291.1 DMT family transporter [Isoptericola sp. b441]MDO8121989.1 DMT family transporter [Isoptericola sp. b490]
MTPPHRSAPGGSRTAPPAASREGSDARTLLEALAIPAMVAIGGLIAVQSTVNGRLAHELGTGMRAGVLAALVSFGSGLVLLATVNLSVPRLRRRVRTLYAAVRVGRLRPWHVLGGTAGAMLVASQGLTVPTIGVALFTVAVVAGQTSSGLAVDHAGLGPSGPRAISTGRMLGAGVTLAAVAIGVSGRLGGAHALTAGALALAALPLVAGSFASWQQAVNGQVSTVGGPLAAALNNFAVGTTTLLVVLAVSFLAPGSLTGAPTQWWLYTGGTLGCVFIASAAVLVRVHGVLVLGLCTVAGQVVTSVLLDALTGTERLAPLTVVGAAVALLGVTLGAWASRGRNPRPGPAH